MKCEKALLIENLLLLITVFRKLKDQNKNKRTL